MKKILLLSISSKEDIEYRKKQKKEELKTASRVSLFDVYSPIYIYDKDKDVIFTFKDLYIAKHSTGIQYKYLINATNSDDIHKSNMFIISTNMDKLKGLINEYYEYLWNK